MLRFHFRWVYGGAEDTSTGSVWWSTDGLEWYASTLTAPWANRMLHAGLVHDGRLWVVGGYDGSILSLLKRVQAFFVPPSPIEIPT